MALFYLQYSSKIREGTDTVNVNSYRAQTKKAPKIRAAPRKLDEYYEWNITTCWNIYIPTIPPLRPQLQMEYDNSFLFYLTATFWHLLGLGTCHNWFLDSDVKLRPFYEIKRRQPWSFFLFFCFLVHMPRFQWAPLTNAFWGVRITLSHSNVTFTELVHQSSTTDVWKAESIKASILLDEKTLCHGAGAQTESTEVHTKQWVTLVREHALEERGDGPWGFPQESARHLTDLNPLCSEVSHV